MDFFRHSEPGGEEKEEERNRFWKKLAKCFEGYKRNDKIVLIGELNAKVVNLPVEVLRGMLEVPGVNEDWERLVHLCYETILIMG